VAAVNDDDGNIELCASRGSRSLRRRRADAAADDDTVKELALLSPIRPDVVTEEPLLVRKDLDAARQRSNES
jgi:hypothetical protein